MALTGPAHRGLRGSFCGTNPHLERRRGHTPEFPTAQLSSCGGSGLGRRVNRLVNISAFMGRPSRQERAQYDAVPRRVVRLLREAGIEFGSLYEDDLYSGALAHDLGLDELVAVHARRVREKLRQHGVRNVITIDPHTTNMLRSVYPTLLDEYDVTVRSYLEVLADQKKPPTAAPTRQIALHDSCVYARHEGIVDEPRTLLAGAGLEVLEPRNAGRLTWCLRRTGGVAVSGESEAGRTVAGNLDRVRHDVPALPRQPDEGRRRTDHLPRHLRSSARGDREQRHCGCGTLIATVFPEQALPSPLDSPLPGSCRRGLSPGSRVVCADGFTLAPSIVDCDQRSRPG